MTSAVLMVVPARPAFFPLVSKATPVLSACPRRESSSLTAPPLEALVAEAAPPGELPPSAFERALERLDQCPRDPELRLAASFRELISPTGQADHVADLCGPATTDDAMTRRALGAQLDGLVARSELSLAQFLEGILSV